MPSVPGAISSVNRVRKPAKVSATDLSRSSSRSTRATPGRPAARARDSRDRGTSVHRRRRRPGAMDPSATRGLPPPGGQPGLIRVARQARVIRPDAPDHRVIGSGQSASHGATILLRQEVQIGGRERDAQLLLGPSDDLRLQGRLQVRQVNRDLPDTVDRVRRHARFVSRRDVAETAHAIRRKQPRSPWPRMSGSTCAIAPASWCRSDPEIASSRPSPRRTATGWSFRASRPGSTSTRVRLATWSSSAPAPPPPGHLTVRGCCRAHGG